MNHLAKAAATALALVLAAGAATAADYTMRIASGTNSGGFVCQNFLNVWAEKIKAESGGRIDYQLFCDGVLGRQGDTISRVEEGIADAGWDVPLTYGNRFAEYGAVGVPGLFDDAERAASALWTLYENGTFPAIDGVRIAMIQATPNVEIWTTKPVEDVADLGEIKVSSGSKMRAELVSALGGVPVALRVPEYYQALSKGAVDGLLSTTSAVYDFSLSEVVHNSVRGRFGGGVIFVVLNDQWYQALPDDLKAVIDANSGREASIWATRALTEDSDARLQADVDAGKVALRPISDAEYAAIGPAFATARQTWIDEIRDGEAALAAFEAALADAPATN